MSEVKMTKVCAKDGCDVSFIPRSSRAKFCAIHRTGAKPVVEETVEIPVVDEAPQEEFDSFMATPDEPVKKSNRLAWVAASVAGVLVVAGAVGATVARGEPDEAVQPRPIVGATMAPWASPTPVEPPTWEAAKACDYVLDYNNGHTLTASAFITNTGNVEFKAKVTATWRQSAGEHITKSKVVDVPVRSGDTEVYLSTKATDNQAEQVMDMPSGKQCYVDISVQ